jgi:hypothetical protein
MDHEPLQALRREVLIHLTMRHKTPIEQLKPCVAALRATRPATAPPKRPDSSPLAPSQRFTANCGERRPKKRGAKWEHVGPSRGAAHPTSWAAVSRPP